MLAEQNLFNSLSKSIERLAEVLNIKKSDIVRDSAIKRFEICFDLAWKCIKIYAREEGIECFSPRSCLKAAFQLGLIAYDESWLCMLADRNLTIHMYRKNIAEEVFSKLPGHLKLLKELSKKFKTV